VTPPAHDCPALVLNADFRPLSYYPLSVWPWQEAVKAVFQDRVNVVCEYDRVVRSPTLEFRLPSVISLKEFVSTSRRPAFTRFNVFLRDNFTCQYCNAAPGVHGLTFDHVVPRAHGGRTTWDNIVAACSPCNTRKGSRTLREVHMALKHRPFRPTTMQLQENGRRFPPNYLHTSWRDFLYWDSELEQ
jgi:5-methylcytosine-specific restriction endonuclease McrA